MLVFAAGVALVAMHAASATSPSATATTTPPSTAPPTTTTASAPSSPPLLSTTSTAPVPSTPPVPSTTTTVAVSQPVVSAEASGAPGVVPPRGQATQWGCAAALAYLAAYASPNFTVECPGNAQGHEGMTCRDWPGICPGQAVIAIAKPCPATYMNEAYNSWVSMGVANGPEDPYGYC
jgi:hypothetical protein